MQKENQLTARAIFPPQANKGSVSSTLLTHIFKPCFAGLLRGSPKNRRFSSHAPRFRPFASRYGFVVFLADSGRHHMLGLQPDRAPFGRCRCGQSRKASFITPVGAPGGSFCTVPFAPRNPTREDGWSVWSLARAAGLVPRPGPGAA